MFNRYVNSDFLLAYLSNICILLVENPLAFAKILGGSHQVIFKNSAVSRVILRNEFEPPHKIGYIVFFD